MYKSIFAAIGALLSTQASASDGFSLLTTAINSFVFYQIPLGNGTIPLVVLALILAAISFTIYLRFVNCSGFMHAIRLVKGDYTEKNSSGQINHFQALATAISGTVGIGNIGGVAIAISMGGVGAIFWLFVAGFFAMSTKFVECTLGVMYREQNADGSVSGGPMYYLNHGLKQMGMSRLGACLGFFYAIVMAFAALGIGNMFQSNQAFSQVNTLFDGSLTEYNWLFGLVLSGMVFSVIYGGIQSIARVTQFLVPIMAGLYVFFGLVVIGMNAALLPAALKMIVTEAFHPSGVAGGMFGVMAIGFQRAVFSNEAGIGSASIAHSAVQTNEPVTEGYVSLLEPFIDTMVICMITALVIATAMIAEPQIGQGLSGIQITSVAFQRSLPMLPSLISICSILFAISTQISWSYYGLKGWVYITNDSKSSQTIYKVIYCLCIIVGCMVNLTSIIDLSDSLVFLICIPNLIGLCILAKQVKGSTLAYMKKIKHRAST